MHPQSLFYRNMNVYLGRKGLEKGILETQELMWGGLLAMCLNVFYCCCCCCCSREVCNSSVVRKPPTSVIEMTYPSHQNLVFILGDCWLIYIENGIPFVLDNCITPFSYSLMGISLSLFPIKEGLMSWGHHWWETNLSKSLEPQCACSIIQMKWKVSSSRDLFSIRKRP